MSDKERLGLFLQPGTKKKLIERAHALGFRGKGQFGDYISFLMENDVIIITDNLRKFIALLDFKSLLEVLDKMGENGNGK